jgi:alpha-D-xyloside xylohydrolase
MLTSHSRCHGVPPKEPWAYDEEFTDDFRRAVELKYRLMPYVYAQAHKCSENGHPMIRTLFFEYPDDPTSWLIEDEYMFGESMLIAPLMRESSGRNVYLPPGDWIDYQSGVAYEGGRWYQIRAGDIPAVILVRAGSAIPHVQLAQNTDRIDWSQLELRVFAASSTSTATGVVATPERWELRSLRLDREGEDFTLRGSAPDRVANLAVRTTGLR